MPRWCTPSCPDAEWPSQDALDGSRSCRTFIALHCKRHDRIVAKNAPCLGERPTAARRKRARSRP